MARYCTRENEPLKRWNGIPIYLTTILTALFVFGLLVSAVLQSMRSPLLERLIFLLPGDMVTPFSLLTYPFIGEISFFTPFAIMCFYWWAVGIETHLGRVILAKLLGLLVLIPAAVAAIAWYGFDIPYGAAGNYLLTAGLVIAFATLYPHVEVWGWIPFKYLAFALLLCGSLMDLAGHRWINLISLWLCAAGGFLYMRRAVDMEHDDVVPALTVVRNLFRKKPKLRVVPPPVPAPKRAVSTRSMVVDEVDLEIDPLLDKIAKTGLASLSNAERAKLERARQELLKKEQA